MTDPKTPAQEMISLLEKNNQLLEAVLEQLGEIAESFKITQPAPDYKLDITQFKTFDWESIGAKVCQLDEDGVASVYWRDKLYLRRSAQNKFGPAIWYSRAVGKDEAGENTYERLATFKEITQAEPLPDKARRAMGG